MGGYGGGKQHEAGEEGAKHLLEEGAGILRHHYDGLGDNGRARG